MTEQNLQPGIAEKIYEAVFVPHENRSITANFRAAAKEAFENFRTKVFHYAVENKIGKVDEIIVHLSCSGVVASALMFAWTYNLESVGLTGIAAVGMYASYIGLKLGFAVNPREGVRMGLTDKILAPLGQKIRNAVERHLEKDFSRTNEKQIRQGFSAAVLSMLVNDQSLRMVSLGETTAEGQEIAIVKGMGERISASDAWDAADNAAVRPADIAKTCNTGIVFKHFAALVA